MATTSATPMLNNGENPFQIQGQTINPASAMKLNPSNMMIGQFGAPQNSGSTSIPAVTQTANPNYNPRQFNSMPTQTSTLPQLSIPASIPQTNYSNDPFLSPSVYPHNNQGGGTVNQGGQGAANNNIQAGVYNPGVAGAAFSPADYARLHAQLNNNTAPPAETNPQTTSNMSQLSQPNTYEDLLHAINTNIVNYGQTAQQSDQELQAQQNLLQAIGKQQSADLNYGNLKANVLGQQLADYGQGVSGGIADANYSKVAFANQIPMLMAQNQQNYAQQGVGIAQTGLNLEQQNRQVRSQVAQNLVGQLQQELGLQQNAIKSVGPGSSLVDQNTGQVMARGNSMTPPTPADITGLATAIYQNGGAQNFGDAYAQAQQIYSGQQQQGQQQSPVSPYSGSTISAMNGNNVFGYDISKYASNPQYGQEVAQKIQQMPQMMNAPGSIQSYINQNYPKSPITGQMIYNASSSAGVSPKLLTAMLAQESQLATDGSAGARMNNPGNYGNSDSAMANGKPTGFSSMQEGVDHVAQWLAQHHASQQPQGQPDVATVVKNYPQLQPAFQTLNDGEHFFEQDKIDARSTALANTISTATGVPIFTPAQADNAKHLDSLKTNLDNLNQLMQKTLQPGVTGRIADLARSWSNNVFQTEPDTVGKMNNYRLAAIGEIQALNGGAGSGLRVNGKEIDSAVASMPSASDSIQTAKAKMQVVNSFLNEKYNQLFPGKNLSTSIESQPQQVQYQGKTYNVDQQGNMTPIQ